MVTIPSQPASRRWTHSILAQRAVVAAIGAGVALLFAMLGGFASESAAAARACTMNQQQGTLCVSISDTPDPVSYSTFDGNATFISYRVVVANESRSSSLSHVGLADTLAPETTLVSATSSRGTCSASGQSVLCPFGALKKGEEATVEIVVTAPATAEPDPVDLVITNTVAASFDERFNDQPNGGKQDTATAAETTVVSRSAGQTFVPAGHSGKVDTDPAQAQYANASIPEAGSDVLATIEVLAPDTFCVDGKVRIQNKRYVCRAGGFVDVSVLNADTGAPYASTEHPLVFHLRWSAELVSNRQTVRNFVVFYQATASAPVQVFATRCNATASNAPCIRNVTPEPDGDWSVDLVKTDNGHMR